MDESMYSEELYEMTALPAGVVVARLDWPSEVLDGWLLSADEVASGGRSLQE